MIGLIFTLVPSGAKEAIARVVDIESEESLAIPPLSVLLTLGPGPRATFTRGKLMLLDTRETFPLQSSAALFHALEAYIARARHPGRTNDEESES